MDIDIREIEIRCLRPNSGEVEGLPRNPRKISKEQLARLKKSLMDAPEMLRLRELIVIPHNGEFIVIAGNQRLEAAKAVGMTALPCKVLPDDTDPAKLREYAIKDNLPFGEDDWEVIASDWDTAELEEWGMSVPDKWKSEATAEEDDFDPDGVKETVCKKGDIWQLGDHRLMCGDSTDEGDVALLMDGEKADMVFTDPPYGVEYTGGIQFKADGSVELNNRKMIENDDKDIYADVFPILRDFVNGPCYIWFAGSKAASLYNAAEKYGEIHSLIIWVKNGGYGALNANYKQKHEPCLYWKPKNATLNFCGATTETTVWNIAKDGINEYHPTQKPVALSAKAIGNHTANSVLDLFGGSGSTMIACEQLNRKCYMMELDPHYCDVIIARWEKLTGKKATKIN